MKGVTQNNCWTDYTKQDASLSETQNYCFKCVAINLNPTKSKEEQFITMKCGNVA